MRGTGSNGFPPQYATHHRAPAAGGIVRPGLDGIDADPGFADPRGADLHAVTDRGDPELDRAWRWTNGVNDTVTDMVHGIPPFPYVRESLAFLADKADMIVVSATPLEALEREWKEHDIAQYVRVIAGQELGKKQLHLQLAAKGKYPDARVLMVGDAPGDMKAAKANNALFYPINPGNEEHSWKRFYEEAKQRFFDGTYAGEYEAKLIAEFDTYLPENPPWK